MQERNRFYTSTETKSDERLDALKELYPEIFKDGKLDFKALKGVTDLANLEVTEEDKSSYGLTWPSKLEAQRMALKKPEGTLVPAEGGKDEDTTKNVYIEGDNLEVLRILRASYKNRIKMIYIDPPYNTGNDFIYPDNFAMPVDEYMKVTGQIDEEGKKLTTNTTTGGSFHTNWLNMMYPRLRLARELLTDDGVIFISIDDNEVANLKLMCDEIFGEENFRNQLLVRRRIKSLNVQFAERGLKSFNVGFEYVLVYSKSDNFLFLPLRMKKLNYSGKGSWNVFWSNADRPSMRYDILGFTPQSGQWRWQKSLADEAVSNYKLYQEKFSNLSLEEYWEKTGKKLKFIRRLPDADGKNGGVQYWCGPDDTSLRTSNWTDIEVSQIAKDFELPFENPKNIQLIQEFIKSVDTNESIILDFFSGSATTAHAVMKLNAIDQGKSKRKFIMVQLPEECGEKSETFKNICEIGKERIRLAGEKIKAEENLLTKDLDVGFKVYKLQKSNFTAYEPVIGQDDKAITNLFERLENQINPLVEGYKDSDVLSEIILRQGFALDCKIEKLAEYTKNKVMRIEDAQDATRKDIVLYVCLDHKIEQETIQNLKLDDGSKFICLNEAIDDTSYARLSDKGRIETL